MQLKEGILSSGNDRGNGDGPSSIPGPLLPVPWHELKFEFMNTKLSNFQVKKYYSS